MSQSPPPPQDYDAFVRQFVRSEPALRAFVRTLVTGVDAVDEVMQETSLVAWRKFATFDRKTNFLAWAGTIARFESLKYRRAKARDRHVFSEQVFELLEREGLEELALREAERRALERCLAKLAAVQREILAAAYAPRTALREVAARFGKSSDAFYKIVQRLRSLLLDCLTREFEAGHES